MSWCWRSIAASGVVPAFSAPTQMKVGRAMRDYRFRHCGGWYPEQSDPENIMIFARPKMG